MRLNELQKETALAESELKALQQKLADTQEEQVFHEKKKLEASVKARDLGYEVRAKQSNYNRIYKKLREQIEADRLEEEQKKIEDLLKEQPSFWEVTGSCLDSLIEQQKREDVLSFTPEVTSSNALITLKRLTEVDNRGTSTEAFQVLEAQNIYKQILTDICRDNIRNKGFNSAKQKQLKQPILQLLNNPRIKSALSIS